MLADASIELPWRSGKCLYAPGRLQTALSAVCARLGVDLQEP